MSFFRVPVAAAIAYTFMFVVAIASGMMVDELVYGEYRLWGYGTLSVVALWFLSAPVIHYSLGRNARVENERR